MRERYGMFSARGDQRVGTLAKRTADMACPIGKERVATPLTVAKMVGRELAKIAKRYDEVYDTDVREQLWAGVERLLREKGMDEYAANRLIDDIYREGI